MVKIVKINTIKHAIRYNKNKKYYDRYNNVMYIYLLKSCYYCNELKPKLVKLYDILKKTKENCLIVEIDAEYLPQTSIPYISEFPDLSRTASIISTCKQHTSLALTVLVSTASRHARYAPPQPAPTTASLQCFG